MVLPPLPPVGVVVPPERVPFKLMGIATTEFSRSFVRK